MWLGNGGCERIEIADYDRDGGDRLGFEIFFIGQDGSRKNA